MLNAVSLQFDVTQFLALNLHDKYCQNVDRYQNDINVDRQLDINSDALQKCLESTITNL